jgi:hypothetical protein
VVTTWPEGGGATQVAWRTERDAFGWRHPSTTLYQPLGFPGQMDDAETAATVWDPACYPTPGCPAGQTVTLRPSLASNWHRTYDPYTGRYLEVDPALIDAYAAVDAPSPQAVGTEQLAGFEWSRSVRPYLYANHDPMATIDWTGWQPIPTPSGNGTCTENCARQRDDGNRDCRSGLSPDAGTGGGDSGRGCSCGRSCLGSDPETEATSHAACRQGVQQRFNRCNRECLVRGEY